MKINKPSAIKRKFQKNKFLIILISFTFFYSCNKDDINPNKVNIPVNYSFEKSDFKGGIQCYDTLGIQIDYVSPNFIKNDFLFSELSVYPYDKIEVANDSSVLFYYTKKELLCVDSGFLTIIKDTLYFYSSRYSSRLIFKGIVVDNKLRIPAYGYKFSTIDGSSSGYYSTTSFGEPNILELLEENNDDYYSGLFIQRFDLLYNLE